MPPLPAPGWLVRAALAALALGLAAAAPIAHRRAAAERERLALSLEHQATSALMRRLAREDPGRGRILAARSLLAAELDPRRWSEVLPGGVAAEQAKSARLLDAAARLAAAALAERPAAWDAAFVLGAATYLSWSQARDPRLLTEHARWEGPLAAARARAPGQREPTRFLAAAYLELWSALAPAKRRQAQEVLASALADRTSFDGLIGPWLAAAPDRRTAFALVPDDPEAWARLEQVLARRQDWPGLADARARRRRTLRRALLADLRQAEERLDRGDLAGARHLFLAVASRAERGVRPADLLERALSRCPAGPVDSATAGRLSGQLDWVLDRCAVAGCPLSPHALERLAGFCRDLEPPRAALAALAAGDLERAALLERRAARQWSEEWAPYLVQKARALAARGRAEGAAAALGQVHRSWQHRPSYWRARAEAAQAAGDPAAAAAAAARLARGAAGGADGWPATAWTFRQGRPRLEVLAPREASGVRLGLDEVPVEGALVELRVDGLPLASAPVLAGAGGTAAVTLAAPLTPGLHLLELDSVAGGRVVPGDVALLPGQGRGGPAGPG